MCSRFYVREKAYQSRDRAAVLRAAGDQIGEEEMTFGFPHPAGKGLIFNARSETVREKEIFRTSLSLRRCAVAADSFNEWDGQKNKYEFTRADGKKLYLAGFYDYKENEHCFVLLTVAANASMEKVHDRMPLILEEKDVESWILDEKKIPAFLEQESPVLSRSTEYEQTELSFFLPS